MNDGRWRWHTLSEVELEFHRWQSCISEVYSRASRKIRSHARMSLCPRVAMHLLKMSLYNINTNTRPVS